MPRPLHVVDASDPHAVLRALKDALAHPDRAILPRQPARVAPPRGEASRCASAPDLPATVRRSTAVVVETSGSTGHPKRVALSADALLASAAASAGALGGPAQWLLALPVHYVAGINVLTRAIAAQTPLVVVPPGHFDPQSFAAAARRLSPDHAHCASLVPAQLIRLLEAAESDPHLLDPLRDFQALLLGGQALPRPVAERAHEEGLPVVRTYGSSETSGGCVYDGRPIGQARARTVAGSVELAGPMLATEYVGDPALTAETFHIEDGVRWYRTGDVGEVVDGILRVSGRADNVIISGGVKVALEAVEEAVHAFGLSRAVVVRASHDQWGEAPVIVVPGTERMPTVDAAARPALTAHPHETRTLEAVRQHVAEALGPAARPIRILVAAYIPLLSSGKVDRRALTTMVAELG